MTDVYTQQHAADLDEEVGRLRWALVHIAEQLTSEELAAKGGYEALEGADFESAYDTVVLFSRKYVSGAPGVSHS